MELENKLNFNDLISEIINQKVIIETKTGTEKEVAIQKLKELESNFELIKGQVGYLTQEVFELKGKVSVLENKTQKVEDKQVIQKKENKEIRKSINKILSTDILDKNTKQHLDFIEFFYHIEPVKDNNEAYAIVREKTHDEKVKQLDDMKYDYYEKNGSSTNRFWKPTRI